MQRPVISLLNPLHAGQCKTGTKSAFLNLYASVDDLPPSYFSGDHSSVLGRTNKSPPKSFDTDEVWTKASTTISYIDADVKHCFRCSHCLKQSSFVTCPECSKSACQRMSLNGQRGSEVKLICTTCGKCDLCGNVYTCKKIQSKPKFMKENLKFMITDNFEIFEQSSIRAVEIISKSRSNLTDLASKVVFVDDSTLQRFLSQLLANSARVLNDVLGKMISTKAIVRKERSPSVRK